MLNSLLYNSRFYVLLSGLVFSVIIYALIFSIVPTQQLQIIRLVQIYGFISIIYLYISLVIGPVCYRFPHVICKKEIIHSRRAIGVLAFYFALLHTVLSFWGELGGFRGLAFLGGGLLLGIVLGFITFIILLLLTITSIDYAVEKLGFINWKLLHRGVYVGTVILLIHMLLIGTHYATLSDVIPQVTFIALAVLLLLEAPRIDAWLKKFFILPKFGMATIIFVAGLSVIYFTIISPFSTGSSAVSFDIHAAHRALAQQAVQQQQFAIDTSKIPGLDGDKNKRYTVSMSVDQQNPQPNQNITLHFNVFDASSGNPISYYKFIYAKQMHLIIVNSALTYFAHIHPIQVGQGFVVTTQLPQSDIYHLYIEFQPYGGIEQQMAFTLPVGNPTTIVSSSQKPDADTETKTFGQYAVSLDTHGALSASAMSFGSQEISFTLKNAQTKQPITDLKPYLAAFGHLTMINEKTYDFIHVHPYSLIVPSPNANGGPTVDFLPIGIYGPFTPGTYRVFAEFNPAGNLFVANFTIRVIN